MNYTLTYSDSAKGWQSFYSFYPERMIGMNNKFYSFKNGRLYLHNSDNVSRNNFYGSQSKSSITGVINEEPNTVKTFKTFVLDSTSPWDCYINTDLSEGFIDADWFSLKEGDYFSYIRRNEDNDDIKLRSAKGIGNVTSVDSSAGTSSVVLTFSFNVGSIISVGDSLYRYDNVDNIFSGTVLSVSSKTITINASTGSVPSDGDFISCVKDKTAESYGATGYFLKYKIDNSSPNFVEIFSIGSNLFKSYP